MNALRAALLCALAAMPVAAHQAPSGWDYSADCCSGMDCRPVSDVAVTEVQGGYAVAIPPGAHPFVGVGGFRAFVPHGDPRIRPSGDGRKHACVSPSGYLLCLYVQPGGV